MWSQDCKWINEPTFGSKCTISVFAVTNKGDIRSPWFDWSGDTKFVLKHKKKQNF